MTELMVAIPWWGWIGIAAAAVVLLVVAVCTVWAAIHRGVLLSRARAHASHGVRISDNEAALIHLHVRPWGVTVHVPAGWMTDAEAAAFAGDVAHRWHRQVRSVTSTRCVWHWTEPVWSIHL